MNYLATYTKFETVEGWSNGPKKPTVTSAGGNNASDITALISSISSDIASLGDGESLSFTVQAMNIPTT